VWMIRAAASGSRGTAILCLGRALSRGLLPARSPVPLRPHGQGAKPLSLGVGHLRRGIAMDAAGRAAVAAAVQKPDERVTIVDLENKVVGVRSRREMRAENLPYRASFVVVRSPDGKVFVQKRVAWKETFPGYYDPCPGGVVGEETYEENAVNELEEEMGIRGVELKAHFDFWFEDEGNRIWGRCFSCTYGGEVTLQESEVESGEWMEPRDVVALMERGPVCPDSAVALKRYLEEAEQLGAP